MVTQRQKEVARGERALLEHIPVKHSPVPGRSRRKERTVAVMDLKICVAR